MILFLLLFLVSCNSKYVALYREYVNPVYETNYDKSLISENENLMLLSFITDLINYQERIIETWYELKLRYPRIILNENYKFVLYSSENDIYLIKNHNYKYFTTGSNKDGHSNSCYYISIYYRTNIYKYIFTDNSLISFRFKFCNKYFEFIGTTNHKTNYNL